MSNRRLTLRIVIAFALVGASSAAIAAGSYRKTDTGIVVAPTSGPEQAVRLQVYGDQIIRVTAAPTATFDDMLPSFMVTAAPQSRGFAVSEGEGRVTLTTEKVRVSVDLTNGNVTFVDSGGRVDLAESGPGHFSPVTVEGKSTLSLSQQFNRNTDEGLFGLGQHQNAQMNYNGEDVELYQHNIVVPIPFLVSTRNYGILWDNNSISRFGNPKPYGYAGDGSDGLRVTNGQGQPGWATHYYLGDRLAVTRTEPVIDYQYIRDQAKWPEAAQAATIAANSGQNTAGNVAQTQRVVWTGKVTPTTTGRHRFRLYSSSYARVFVDGKEVSSAGGRTGIPGTTISTCR